MMAMDKYIEKKLSSAMSSSKKDKDKNKNKPALRPSRKEMISPPDSPQSTKSTDSLGDVLSQQPEGSLEAFQGTSSTAKEVCQALLPYLDKRFDGLHSTIQTALTNIASNSKRLGEAEQRISDLEDQALVTKTTTQAHQTLFATLQEKIEDLENRHRRSNLRFIGIPETIKPAQLLEYVTTMIPSALGLPPNDERAIERVHRMGPERSATLTRNRPVIAKYFHFQDKEAILRAYRRVKELKIESNKILIFQDYSAALSQKRREFSPICKELIQRNIRFTMMYPAKLKITYEGAPRILETLQEAQEFLSTMDTMDQGSSDAVNS